MRKRRNSTNESLGWLQGNPQAGRAVAQRKFRDLGICESCNTNPAIDRHHVDNNTQNNERSNVQFLCRKCHMVADGRSKKEGGITWRPTMQKWQAQVYLRKENGVSKYKYLGYYDTKEEALEAIRIFREKIALTA